MPARSFAARVPAEALEWLKGRLIKGNFKDYTKLADAFNAKLAELGVELRVSKSAVHRFGQDVEERIADLKRSTEIVKTVAQQVGDDAGELNDTVQRLIQNRMFHLMMDLEGKLELKDFVKIAHAAADVGRANVSQKKWQQLVHDRARAVSEKVAEQAKKGGLSPEAVEKIKSEILGIASAA